MKRWNSEKGDEVENPAVDLFLQEIEEVCKKHGYSILHEDGHGAFEVGKYTEGRMDWLREAHVC